MCGFSYLLALLVIHLLVARMEPAQLVKVASGTKPETDVDKKARGTFSRSLTATARKPHLPYGK
jgi:hypothetical protein